jgi:hypothetical protein
MKTNTSKLKKHIQLRQEKSKNLQNAKDREQREAVMHLDVDSTGQRVHSS